MIGKLVTAINTALFDLDFGVKNYFMSIHIRNTPVLNFTNNLDRPVGESKGVLGFFLVI